MIKEYGKDEVRSRRVLRGTLIAIIGILLVLILIKFAPLAQRMVILPIRKVQIYGNQYVTKREIVQLMGIDVSTSILTFSKRSAKESLLGDRRISYVEMAKLYPDTLKVYVREKGALSIISDKNADYWVSSDGVVMSKVNEKASIERFPRITLKSNNDDIKIGERVNDFFVLDILSALEGMRDEYPDFFGQLSSFSVGKEGIQVHLAEDLFLVWLGCDVTKQKLEGLRALLIVLKSEQSGFQREGMLREGVEIDMSSTHAAVRMRGSNNGP